MVPRIGQPSGWSFQKALREQLVHQHVRIVLVDLDLFQNHAALALDVGRGKDRVEHQVGQHIQGDGHVLGQRLDVEADGLLAGEGVQVAADRVHLAGNVLGGAGAGALEEHVLHKVGDAVGLRRLAAGAGLDPHAHGHRTQVLHALGQHDQAVRQYGAAKISLSGHRHPVRFDCRATGRKGHLLVFKTACAPKVSSETGRQRQSVRARMKYWSLSLTMRRKPSQLVRLDCPRRPARES